MRFAQRIGRRKFEQAGEFGRADKLAVATEEALFTAPNFFISRHGYYQLPSLLSAAVREPQTTGAVSPRKL